MLLDAAWIVASTPHPPARKKTFILLFEKGMQTERKKYLPYLIKKGFLDPSTILRNLGKGFKPLTGYWPNL